MRQITKNNNKIKKRSSRKPSKSKQLYGTSKLEEDFAKYFLDKLGIRYTYQFEAKEIGRFFDYYLPDHNILIEIDGGYW
jgi:hypothetical protein